MTIVGTSWGRWPRCEHTVVTLSDRFASLPDANSMLAFGNGRSYGDVCLNDKGTLLSTRSLDRFISFDPASGVLECEAGVLLKEIIDRFLPYGWFPAVTPGTAFVTVGGAIANDVHGKNHHRAGSFGNHVLEFELLRSDGQVLICSPTANADWFAATVGGLGLTGLIRRVKFLLRRVPGPWIRGDSHRFADLHEFFQMARDADADYEYTVAWIDCSAGGSRLGRGVFMRGNHLAAFDSVKTKSPLKMPFTPPVSLVNSLSLRTFNQLYFYRPSAEQDDALWHYEPFFYPLDSILD